ncbi:MAG: CRTAC1 family protein [Planctomycetota bacterium]
MRLFHAALPGLAWVLVSSCAKESATSKGVGLADESAARGLELTAARGDDYFMPDSMGPGCALFDADGDKDLDAFFVQGARGADKRLESEAGRDRLFLQGPDGRFSDASTRSGLDDARYGMGAAVADVDSDGDLDLFVTNYGSSRLFLNRGDASFEDATEAAGIVEEGWAASAGFFDYDADGKPDLFVARYLELDLEARAVGDDGVADYLSPLQFPGLPAHLWHNEGAGKFRDVSSEAGISQTPGRGLGLAFLDLDDDGRIDIFVANDSEPNFAWVQIAPGRFENRAFALGLAVNRVGRPEANMGVALGDCDGDGTLDLFVTHLVAETNTLFRRSSKGKYADSTEGTGLGPPSLDLTGFGTVFFDAENDGDLDLAVLNGRIMRRGPRSVAKLSPHWQPYAEENQLFVNSGAGRFSLATAKEWGDWTTSMAVGRALALGDVDRDGALDLLVCNADGSSRLFMNRSAARGHYLCVRALDASGRCDALGATIEVRAASQRWLRPVTTCQGYLSAGDAKAHFGLGAVTSIDTLVVHWPGGDVETFAGGSVDRELELRRGSGSR